MLALVKPYLFSRGLHFKHIRSRTELETRNSRRIPGDLFGKFVTIYPETQVETEEVATKLVSLTNGFKGPRILTDIQIGESIVHIRYGPFVLQTAINPETGFTQEFMTKPNGGVEWVERKSTFSLPDWAPVSPWINELIRAHRAKDVILPYTHVVPLRNTSRGLTFSAIFEGKEAFVKEGRRRSEVDQLGRDTVCRFYREKKALEMLKDIKGVPRFLGCFDAGPSVFFAYEFIHGRSMNSWIVEQIGRAYHEIEKDTYLLKLGQVLNEVRQILSDAHEIGIFHYDLSPENIILEDSGDVYVVDWEGTPDSIDEARVISTDGFTGSLSVRGTAADYYSLGRVAAFALTGHGPILDVFPDNKQLLREYAKSLFGEPGETLFDEYCGVGRERLDSPENFSRPLDRVSSESLVLGIGASKGLASRVGLSDVYLSERNDIYTFGSGIGSLLCALRLMGHSDKELENRWVQNSEGSIDEDDISLWSGHSGYIVTSLTLGLPLDDKYLNTYFRKVEEVLEQPMHLDHSLTSGIGGLIVALESLMREKPYLFENRLEGLAKRIEEVLNLMVLDRRGNVNVSPGLLYGWSGTVCSVLNAVALFGSLDVSPLVSTMIEQEERRLKHDRRGRLQVSADGKFLPYLGVGSAGVIWARDAARHSGVGTNPKVDSLLLPTVMPGVIALPSLMKGASGLKLLAKRRMVLGLPSPSPAQYDREILLSSGCFRGHSVVIGDDARSINSSFTGGAAGVAWAEKITPNSPMDFIPTPLFGK
ncbi:hypothetical protein DF219_06445 [Corynebacterium liangguodongii]|nr:hypothetical protein DF219_06445 [Corynebacterium liangguodongii]